MKKSDEIELLLVTPSFSGKKGGIEMVCQMIAIGFNTLGYHTTIVSLGKDQATEGTLNDVRILTKPRARDLISLYSNAKRVLIVQGTANLGWPAIIFRRKCIIGYHIWDTWRDRSSILGYMTRRLMNRLIPTVACSRYLSCEIGRSCNYLPNPYNAERFRLLNTGKREIDVLFVGRIICWKGVAILLKSLSILQKTSSPICCTIVGDGPEKDEFETLSRELNLQELRWLRGLPSDEVSKLMNRSKVLVIPSTWDEPFGLVAIEGLACGCRVIASNCGGLPQAIGKHGLLIPKADANELALAIQKTLQNWSPIEAISSELEAHLAEHKPEQVAMKYLEQFSNS